MPKYAREEIGRLKQAREWWGHGKETAASWLVDRVLDHQDKLMEAGAGVCDTTGITDPKVAESIRQQFYDHSQRS